MGKQSVVTFSCEREPLEASNRSTSKPTKANVQKIIESYDNSHKDVSERSTMRIRCMHREHVDRETSHRAFRLLSSSRSIVLHGRFYGIDDSARVGSFEKCIRRMHGDTAAIEITYVTCARGRNSTYPS